MAAVTFNQGESANEILSTFFSQTVQCERVANSLLNYIKSLRSMRDANRHVTSSMIQLCPSNWTGQNRDKLAMCLEDQCEVLNMAEGFIRDIFPRLKRHHLCIDSINSILIDLERKMRENNEMHYEYEQMKIHHRLSRQQEEQIRFMLRDTDRAIGIITGDVADRLNGMEESTYTIVKDVLMKFEEVQEIISLENLEIILVVSTLIKTLPKPRPKFSRLNQEDCSQIIKAFKECHSQLLETKKTMAENKKERPEKISVKERLRGGIKNKAKPSLHNMESELQELSNQLEYFVYGPENDQSSSEKITISTSLSATASTETSATEETGIESTEVTEATSRSRTTEEDFLSTVEEDKMEYETESSSKRSLAVHEYEEARQAGSQQLLYQRDPNANPNVTPMSSKLTKNL